MDFSFTDVQLELRALVRQILNDRATLDRLVEIEAGPDGFDRALWRELAEANILGIALSEDVGGSGYGVMELAVTLAEVGRRVAPVPLLATVGMAALAIDHFGTPKLRQDVLPDVIAGRRVLTAALQEPGARDPSTPATTATREAGGWRLSGHKVAVPWAPVADQIIVAARTESGAPALFLVDSDAAGLTLEPQRATHREPAASVVCDGVVVGDDALLGETSSEPLTWLIEHSLAGLCANAVGVLEESVRITAGYLSERQQFERPLGTFQGAALQTADAFIDTTATAVATWSAIWRLSVGRPARDELAIAKFWVADGGQRVVRTCQHLHGGMGVDIDYSIHRYFLQAKHLELTLGSATDHLLRVGESLAGAR